ncbi:MAG: hypothetical protein AAGH71_08100 [Planctomycetota bacterium]
MHPLLLSGLLLGIGLLIAIVGRAWRCGRHPVCRGCGFHLAGLNAPSACPECGRDLTRRRAIATGDRRRWPVPAGLVLVALGVLSLGYALIDNPAMDPRKPVWVLAAEHRLFGQARENRLLDEIERRVAAVPETEAERRQLAEFVFAVTAAADLDPRWHGRAIAAIQQGLIDADRASERAARLLQQYAGLPAESVGRLQNAMERYAEPPTPSEDAIIPLLERVEAEFAVAEAAGESEIDRWMVSPARAVLSAWMQTNHQRVSQATLDRIIGDFEGLAFRAKALSVRGDRLPLEIEMMPRLLAYGEPLWLHSRVLEVRVNGEPIDHAGERRSTSGIFGVGNRAGRSTLRFARAVPPSTHLGEVGVEVDVEIAVSFASEPSDRPPPGRVFTRSSTFRLVEAGEAVEWAQSDDPDGHRRALESIGVVGVTYFTGQSAVQARRWHFPLRVFNPPYDIAHALWAEQGDHRWRIGEITVRAGANAMTTLSGPLDRLVNRDGRVVNETVHPDLTRPVRIVLEPEAAIALRQVDTARPWGARIDLGSFDISETDQWTGFGVSSDMFRPPPALAEPQAGSDE